MNLKHLSDNELLFDTKNLALKERVVSVEVLQHFKEIEKRRLFSELGYGSMFEYAVRELGYSEPSAGRRIQAARMLKELPFLEKKIANGSLNMTNISLAGQLFKQEDIDSTERKKEILAKIENATKKECENELIKYRTQEPVPREKIQQVTSELHSLKINICLETLQLFEEARAVVAHSRLSQDQLLNRLLKTSLPIWKNKKFKINSRTTTLAASPSITRHVPAIIKKQVYNRDKGRCVKCEGTYKLEFDHIKPFAEGGLSTLNNLRLLCFSCNQRRHK